MGRRTLVDDLVDGLLDDILDGKLQPHEAIPPEADIAKAYDVSRLTVREALKALRAQNILYVKAGRGTFVNPADNWTGLDAIFKAASHGNGGGAGRRGPDRNAPHGGNRGRRARRQTPYSRARRADARVHRGHEALSRFRRPGCLRGGGHRLPRRRPEGLRQPLYPGAVRPAGSAPVREATRNVGRRARSRCTPSSTTRGSWTASSAATPSWPGAPWTSTWTRRTRTTNATCTTRLLT